MSAFPTVVVNLIGSNDPSGFEDVRLKRLLVSDITDLDAPPPCDESATLQIATSRVLFAGYRPRSRRRSSCCSDIIDICSGCSGLGFGLEASRLHGFRV